MSLMTYEGSTVNSRERGKKRGNGAAKRDAGLHEFADGKQVASEAVDVVHIGLQDDHGSCFPRLPGAATRRRLQLF